MKPIADRRLAGERGHATPRRRYPRVQLLAEAFFESPERILVARVRDLNLRGAFLSSAAPDRPGNLGAVRLVLPDSPSMLRVEAQVLWASEDGERGARGMALRFLELQAWQCKRLAAALLAAGGWAAFPALRRAVAAA
jgi:hypothetical protein